MAFGSGHKLADLYLGIKMDLRSMRRGFRDAEDEVKTFVGRIGAASQGLSMLGKGISAYGKCGWGAVIILMT